MKAHRLIGLIFIIMVFAGHTAAQKKNVDAAWRLVGKTESVSEARRLIKEAMKHERTANEARTWFVAAMIEWRSYEADVRKREINPKDGSVKDADMAEKMLAGYRYLKQALAFDTLPDRKGKVKPRFVKEIHDQLDSRAYDLYSVAVSSYNAGKYYPEAYEGFLAAASLASDPTMERSQRQINDTVRANVFYFAGLSAYGGKKPILALDAMRKAESDGVRTDTMYLYQMAIWEQLARDSIHLRQQAQDSLLDISRRAYAIHGIKQPEFLSRLTQLYIAAEQTDSILPLLNAELLKSPEEWLPRALRGWVYESLGRNNDAIADYKLAAEHPGISAKMLMRGAHAMYRAGHAAKKDVTGNLRQRRAISTKIIQEYLQPAMQMAKRAQEISSDPKDLELIQNILDAVDYDISLLK